MIFSLLLACFVGCGQSNSAPGTMAEQDELARYAAENPSPPETPVE